MPFASTYSWATKNVLIEDSNLCIRLISDCYECRIVGFNLTVGGREDG